MKLTSRKTVTRSTQKTDVIYVYPGGGIFVTPDGEGRFFYDSIEEAQQQHGDDLEICYLDEYSDDW